MKTSAKNGRTRRMGRRTVWGSSVVLALSTLVACQGTAEDAAPEPGAATDSQALLSSSDLTPTLKWAWTGSAVLPDYKQVMTTPVVIDLNRDGVPDIIFSTFAGANYDNDGVLRAISGDTGRELWTVTDPTLRVKAGAGLTAGDLDGDGRVDVCAIPENGRGVLCFNHEGRFKLRTPEGAYDYNEWGAPALADLDGDGQVEILDGNRVYSSTGALKWVGADGMGGAKYTGPNTFAADIDQDGQQEVINGRSVYRADGSLLCAPTSVPHGFAAVGNFDADPQGEIVVAGRDELSLIDDTCTVLWSIPVPGGGHGGVPNIADFDGDGQPEIGIAGNKLYSVIKADGRVLWSHAIRDLSSGKNSSTTFDFNGDGKLEVVFTDETKLRILDGATGTLVFETLNSSGTTHEGPVVADVDADGQADIVVGANSHAYPGFNGIRVFHGENWRSARRIWNQHAYSITNINDDGTIPAQPVANWLSEGLNTFRSNGPGPGAGYCAPGTWTPAPSLSAGRIFHTATKLLDGRVLVVGGYQTTTELFDPASNTWSRTGSARTTHRYHTATLLTDGRVLVTGVVSASSNISAEVYDPASGTWSATTNLATARLRHAGVRLNDGRVLVIGGQTPSGSALASAELYNPATGAWTATGSLNQARYTFTATALSNGRVLVTGGSAGGANLASAEVYDPATGVWTNVGSMTHGRLDHTATALPGGKVLVVGGESNAVDFATAELFDAARGTWSSAGSLSSPRRDHSATLLPSGAVLVAGGYNARVSGILSTAELFDPSTRSWCGAASMNTARYYHTATRLDDGRTLVVAGHSNVDQAAV
ncbi:MAG: kelch repeat-containing protein, partial [Cystobacter sp.]